VSFIAVTVTHAALVHGVFIELLIVKAKLSESF